MQQNANDGVGSATSTWGGRASPRAQTAWGKVRKSGLAGTLALPTVLLALTIVLAAQAGDLVFQRVAVGSWHTVAIKGDGTLWAWGNNGFGQLGDGTTTDKSSPVEVGTATSWQAVSAGAFYTVAIKRGGTLKRSSERWPLHGDGATCRGAMMCHRLIKPWHSLREPTP